MENKSVPVFPLATELMDSLASREQALKQVNTNRSGRNNYLATWSS
jgi:hypothetical protein